MAQFSGTDNQMSQLPTENTADTNPELQDALQNKLQNQYQNTPKFNPRPRFPGS